MPLGGRPTGQHYPRVSVPNSWFGILLATWIQWFISVIGLTISRLAGAGCVGGKGGGRSFTRSMGVSTSLLVGHEICTYGLPLCSSSDNNASRVFNLGPSFSTCRSNAYMASRLDWMSSKDSDAGFRPSILSRSQPGCTGRSQGWYPKESRLTRMTQG